MSLKASKASIKTHGPTYTENHLRAIESCLNILKAPTKGDVVYGIREKVKSILVFIGKEKYGVVYGYRGSMTVCV